MMVPGTSKAVIEDQQQQNVTDTVQDCIATNAPIYKTPFVMTRVLLWHVDYVAGMRLS